jgi:hypothetical protein
LLIKIAPRLAARDIHFFLDKALQKEKKHHADAVVSCHNSILVEG